MAPSNTSAETKLAPRVRVQIPERNFGYPNTSQSSPSFDPKAYEASVKKQVDEENEKNIVNDYDFTGEPAKQNTGIGATLGATRKRSGKNIMYADRFDGFEQADGKATYNGNPVPAGAGRQGNRIPERQKTNPKTNGDRIFNVLKQMPEYKNIVELVTVPDADGNITDKDIVIYNHDMQSQQFALEELVPAEFKRRVSIPLEGKRVFITKENPNGKEFSNWMVFSPKLLKSIDDLASKVTGIVVNNDNIRDRGWRFPWQHEGNGEVDGKKGPNNSGGNINSAHKYGLAIDFSIDIDTKVNNDAYINSNNNIDREDKKGRDAVRNALLKMPSGHGGLGALAMALFEKVYKIPAVYKFLNSGVGQLYTVGDYISKKDDMGFQRIENLVYTALQKGYIHVDVAPNEIMGNGGMTIPGSKITTFYAKAILNQVPPEIQPGVTQPSPQTAMTASVDHIPMFRSFLESIGIPARAQHALLEGMEAISKGIGPMSGGF